MAKNDLATKADLKPRRGELTKAVRDMETRLLKVFYDIAESTEMRLTNLERTTSGVTDRLATLERRFTDLEKRVNFPHAP